MENEADFVNAFLSQLKLEFGCNYTVYIADIKTNSHYYCLSATGYPSILMKIKHKSYSKDITLRSWSDFYNFNYKLYSPYDCKTEIYAKVKGKHERLIGLTEKCNRFADALKRLVLVKFLIESSAEVGNRKSFNRDLIKLIMRPVKH